MVFSVLWPGPPTCYFDQPIGHLFYWFCSSWKRYWSAVTEIWGWKMKCLVTSGWHRLTFLSSAGPIGSFCLCRWYWWSWYSIGSQFLVCRRKASWWSSRDELDHPDRILVSEGKFVRVVNVRCPALLPCSTLLSLGKPFFLQAWTWGYKKYLGPNKFWVPEVVFPFEGKKISAAFSLAIKKEWGTILKYRHASLNLPTQMFKDWSCNGAGNTIIDDDDHFHDIDDDWGWW